MARKFVALRAIPYLTASLLLFAACNDDSVIADYTCNDGVCSAEEDHASCPADCLCGDGECGAAETAISCPVDCAGPTYYGPCRSELDIDVDGTLEEVNTWTYETVGDGTRIFFASDNGVDGTIDNSWYETHDLPHRVIRYESDHDLDGVIDSVTERTHSATGVLTMEETFQPPETLTSRTRHEYDTQGHLLQTRRVFFDGGHPGVIDYLWNADFTSATVEHDTFGMNDPDRIDYLTYDAWGNIATGAYDTDADGSIDIYEELVWNADGQILEAYRDRDADDDFDRIELYTYDAHGNRLLEEGTLSPPYENDGYVRTWYYDCWQ